MINVIEEHDSDEGEDWNFMSSNGHSNCTYNNALDPSVDIGLDQSEIYNTNDSNPSVINTKSQEKRESISEQTCECVV